MRTPPTFAAAAAALALGAAPAAAFATTNPHPNNGRANSAPGHTRTSSSSSDTAAVSPSQARAYGRLCQKESKRHVSGQKGTPFSKCVHDLAQLAKAMKNSSGASSTSSTSGQSSSDANRSSTNPHAVCANESLIHVRGLHGTPYSQCVVAAAKLRSEKRQPSSSSTATSPTT